MMIRYAVAGLVAIFLAGTTNTEVFAGQFDGTWKYSISTKSSSPTCRGFRSGSFKIENGIFSGVIPHDQDVFRISGEVSDEGKANFKARGNYAAASFDISFTPNTGSGTWKDENSLGCVGTIELTNKNPKPTLKKQAPSQPTLKKQAPSQLTDSPSKADLTSRLEAVKRLREQGLITEAEAAEKRREILEGL